jgi:hypothetical protein
MPTYREPSIVGVVKSGPRIQHDPWGLCPNITSLISVLG